jgi:hypothetical protein
MKCNRVFICLFLAAWASAVSADTLRLKNGQVIQGYFMGGSPQEIQFLGPDGRPKSYPLQDIDSLTFQPASKPAQPAPAAAPARVSVPAGTLIMVRMMDSLDTSKTKTGQIFTATLETNLAAQGAVVARKGTTVHGKVLKSSNARRLTGHSELQLALTDIVIGGTAYAIQTGDFEAKGKGEGAQTLKKTAGGAGLGAAIGAIAGDAGQGAAIGAVAGVGLAMTKKGEPIRVPSETLVQFTLKQPVTLPVGK